MKFVESIKKRAKSVTIVADEKNKMLANLLSDLIAEKQYKTAILTPKQFENNAVTSSDNKVIFLAPSKLYDERVNTITNKQYDKYGMIFGWRVNQCVIGVDVKKVKLEDKDEIQKLFPEEKYIDKEKTFLEKKFGYTAETKVKRKEKKISKKISNAAIVTTLTAPPLARLITTAYVGSKMVKNYTNKKELVEDMRENIIPIFIAKGLVNFMENN